MPSEFEIIRRTFDRPARSADLGVGDDAALVRVANGNQLAVSTDMLLEGRHFPAGTDPRTLGHKSLAVNLSDMAAMGARPRWATLAIALPTDDEHWLEAYAEGFYALAERYAVELIGGDTTRGPLALSITILGEVPRGQALLRSGARPEDDIWVSGTLGGATLGLAHMQGRVQLDAMDTRAAIRRLELPEPRVELGLSLCGIASAAIDVSDGFAGDLGHILERSGVAARVECDRLPAFDALARLRDKALMRRCMLSGGDDYELIFTAPPSRAKEITELASGLGLALTRVGRIESGGGGLSIVDADGRVVPHTGGFDHFREGA